MSTFDDWLHHTWNHHASDPAAAAAQLEQGSRLLGSAAELGPLANLTHHLLGEHLGQWADGTTALRKLQGHALLLPESDAARTLEACLASLALSAGDDTASAVAAMAAPQRVQALALAAGNLATRNAARAGALLQQALAEAEATLDDDKPAASRLAVAANNLALILEDKALRSADERALMVRAAHGARRWWAVAGGWLEIERAEYRLAISHLHADDASTARRHAQLCLEAVQAHAAPPLEHFYGWEALGLAERACGDSAGHARALTQAKKAFAALDADDRAGCQASLDKLADAPRTAP